MAKVQPLSAFVAAVPVKPGENHDFTQDERRINEDGTTKTVRVAYRRVVVNMESSRRATSNDIKDDENRVAAGGASWLRGQRGLQTINVPACVRMGGKTTYAKPGEALTFMIDDAVADKWAAMGMVRIITKSPTTTRADKEPA